MSDTPLTTNASIHLVWKYWNEVDFEIVIGTFIKGISILIVKPYGRLFHGRQQEPSIPSLLLVTCLMQPVCMVYGVCYVQGPTYRDSVEHMQV